MLLKQLRQTLVDVGIRMLEAGIAHDGQGNLSVYDRTSGHIVITPSAIPYRQREAKDICVVDREKTVIEGEWRPTSEIDLHMVYYKNREDVNAVLHCHAPYATVFSITGEDSLPMILTEAAMSLGGALPIAPYARPGTGELAQATFEATGDGAGAIMAHHGLVTVGRDIEQAFLAALAVEATARTLFMARAMGADAHTLPLDEVRALSEMYQNHYGASKRRG